MPDWQTLFHDLDRCEHGRHAIDRCLMCPPVRAIGGRWYERLTGEPFIEED